MIRLDTQEVGYSIGLVIGRVLADVCIFGAPLWIAGIVGGFILLRRRRRIAR